MKKTNIYLTGFMAVGKTTVGIELAKLINLPFIDLDELINLSSGCTPAQIIQERGEEYFRQIERKALKKVVSLENCVIALGGGTALDEKSFNLIKTTGTVVWLKAKADTILERMKQAMYSRPLFDLMAYEDLMKTREKWYMRSDVIIETDLRRKTEIAYEIKDHLNINRQTTKEFQQIKRVRVKYAKPYDVVLSNRLNYSLGKLFSEIFAVKGLCADKNKGIIVTSPVLKCLYGSDLEEILANFRIEVIWFLVEDGEKVKKLKFVEEMYSTAAKLGLTKNSLVISLGGGSIGDTAGFFAATYCRGLSFIQVPTTLLAMADSSIGGKNGVNLEEGKNLVGTIWQPSGVAIGTNILTTLNNRELSAGMAEVVKTAIIGDKILFEMVEKNIEVSRKVIDWPDLPEITYRAAIVKIALVEKDERDYGDRKLLNLGHTTAHALEAIWAYRDLSHGQAVSIGIAVATQLAAGKARLSKENGDRIKTLLKKLGLLRKLKYIDVDNDFVKRFDVATSLDKKNVNEKTNLVIPIDIGKCVVTSEYDKIDLINAIISLKDECL